MRSRTMILALVVAVVVVPVSTHARTSRTVEYLMSEPLTLWDSGLMRLSEHVRVTVQEAAGIYAFVSTGYDWDSGRLLIEIMHAAQPSDSLDTATAKALSLETVNRVRKSLRVDPATGLTGYAQHSYLASFFSHRSVLGDGEPDSMGDDLDKITYIYVECVGLLGSGTLMCEAPLLGTEAEITEKVSTR